MRVSIIYFILFSSFKIFGQTIELEGDTSNLIDYFYNDKNKLQYLHHSIYKGKMNLSQKEIKQIIESYNVQETKIKLQNINLHIRKEIRKTNTNLITASVLFCTGGLVAIMQKGLGQQDIGVISGAIYSGFGFIFLGVCQSHRTKARSYKKQFVDLHNKVM